MGKIVGAIIQLTTRWCAGVLANLICIFIQIGFIYGRHLKPVHGVYKSTLVHHFVPRGPPPSKGILKLKFCLWMIRIDGRFMSSVLYEFLDIGIYAGRICSLKFILTNQLLTWGPQFPVVFIIGIDCVFIYIYIHTHVYLLLIVIDYIKICTLFLLVGYRSTKNPRMPFVSQKLLTSSGKENKIKHPDFLPEVVPKTGVPHLSSILGWDFPCNQPSIRFGYLHDCGNH